MFDYAKLFPHNFKGDIFPHNFERDIGTLCLLRQEKNEPSNTVCNIDEYSLFIVISHNGPTSSPPNFASK